MQHYQHVLFASDLSAASDTVAAKALNVAQKANAKLSLVHIVEFSSMMYGGGEYAVPISGDIEASVYKNAEEELAKQGERLGIATQDQYIESGSTAEGLNQLVKKLKIDLLVVGSHEQHGLSFLLGSTANTMLHAMPCDILAVHVG